METIFISQFKSLTTKLFIKKQGHMLNPNLLILTFSFIKIPFVTYLLLLHLSQNKNLHSFSKTEKSFRFSAPVLTVLNGQFNFSFKMVLTHWTTQHESSSLSKKQNQTQCEYTNFTQYSKKKKQVFELNSPFTKYRRHYVISSCEIRIKFNNILLSSCIRENYSIVNSCVFKYKER